MKRMVAKTDIVETVNKAIEDGEIQTKEKLYKHIISGFAQPTAGQMTVISTRKTNYNERLDNLFKDQQNGIVKSAAYSGPTSITMGWFVANSQLAGFTSGGTTATLNFSRGSSKPTETITEI